MTELFQTSRTNVVEHIKHIYEEGELDGISTCRKEGNGGGNYWKELI